MARRLLRNTKTGVVFAYNPMMAEQPNMEEFTEIEATSVEVEAAPVEIEKAAPKKKAAKKKAAKKKAAKKKAAKKKAAPEVAPLEADADLMASLGALDDLDS